jgi:WD40 repeat protein
VGLSPSAGSDWLNLVEHTDRVFFVTYSPDGPRFATRSSDGTAKVWAAASGKELLSIPYEDCQCDGSLSFSPHGKRLAVVSGKTAKIVDAESGAEILALTPFEVYASTIVYSPDGTRLAAGGHGSKANVYDSTVRIYDSTTGQVLVKFAAHKDNIQQMAFSPDGTRLAMASGDGTAKVWDVLTGKQLLVYDNKVRISGIGFSPDGKHIATSSNDGTIKVWSSETGKEIFNLTGHTGPTFGVAFSPDGQYLASSSVDRTIKVWKLPSDGGQVVEPLTLYGHTATVYRIAFSPDGLYLATAGRNPIVRIYALHIDKLIAIAKSRLTRELTQEECKKYLHMEICPNEP